MRGVKSTVGKVLIALALASFVLLWVGIVWASLWPDSFPLYSAADTPGQLDTLDPQGPSARRIQDLVAPVFGIAGVIFVAVLGAIFAFSIKFRDKDEDDTDVPEQVHGKTALEIGWTILPALILFVVAILTVFTIVDLEQREDDAIKVEVFGQQWWWGYRYDVNDNGSFDDPEDIVTATELVVPVGREVDLTITSNDVIHSFWIPALNGKKDAVPGMTSDWKLEAASPGTYRGQCTEYCGLSHANMRMLVRAIPAEDYDAWVADQQQPAADPSGELAQAGKTQFENLCAGCHLIDGVNNETLAETPPSLVSGVAPNLTHLMSRGTFAGSILNLHYPNPPGNDQPLGATCTTETLSECGDPTDVALPGNPDNPIYAPALEAWLRDPEAVKPMAPDENRGMPNLQLTEQQIDELVAYLETLK